MARSKLHPSPQEAEAKVYIAKNKAPVKKSISISQEKLSCCGYDAILKAYERGGNSQGES